MKLTKPLININGNDAKTLAKELMEVVKHIDDAREALGKCEYDDGRNAKDFEHAYLMKGEKRKLMGDLDSITVSLIGLIRDINNYK